MFFRSSLNKFRSPEGPFSTTPKWLKKLVPYVANSLGIGIYELEERHKLGTARFIAKHKEETLFVLFRILQEVVLINGTDDSDTYLGHILCRLFGQSGGEVIVNAVSEYQSDADAVADAKRRGNMLAHAANGLESILTSAPEFELGIAGGREFAAISPGMEFNRDVDLAYWGLHYLWFSKILASKEFEAWVNAEASTNALYEGMIEVEKLLKRK